MPRTAERAGEELVPDTRSKTPAYAVEEMGGMFWAYHGPGREQAAAAAHRRLRHRRHDPHARQRAHSGATGSRSWRTRSTRSTPNGCTATPTSSSRSRRARATRSRSARATRRSRSANSSTASPSTGCSTGQSEECDDWKVGHPVVFPNILSVGNGDESQLALLRVPDPRAGRRHPHPAPLVHGLRAAEGLEGRAAPARQGHTSTTCRTGTRTATTSWTTSTART